MHSVVPNVHKDYRELVRRLRDNGCTFQSGSKHVLVFGPTGTRVGILPRGGGSHLSGHAAANARAHYQRLGLLDEPIQEDKPMAAISQADKARSAHVRRRVTDVIKELEVTKADFVRVAIAEGRRRNLRLPKTKGGDLEPTLQQSLSSLSAGRNNSDWVLDLWEAAIVSLTESSPNARVEELNGELAERARQTMESANGDSPEEDEEEETPKRRQRRIPRTPPPSGVEPFAEPSREDEIASLRVRYIELLFEEREFDRLERILGLGP